MVAQHAAKGYVRLRTYEHEMVLLSHVYLPHPYSTPATKPEMDASYFPLGMVYQAPATPLMRHTARLKEQRRDVVGVRTVNTIHAPNLEANVGGSGGEQVVCECCRQQYVGGSVLQRVMRKLASRVLHG
jgi:hypothetical protein